jgi:hypothetical protein
MEIEPTVRRGLTLAAFIAGLTIAGAGSASGTAYANDQAETWQSPDHCVMSEDLAVGAINCCMDNG